MHLLHLYIFNDHNGDYRGTDKKVYRNAGFTNYSVFSLWDTYRAAHPLYTLVQPERVPDMIKSMLAIYQQQGKLPIWALMGCETDCMVGYSAVPVVADAVFKNFEGIDTELAFEAMKASATRDDYGMKYMKQMGFIPADKEKESVRKRWNTLYQTGVSHNWHKSSARRRTSNIFRKEQKLIRHITIRPLVFCVLN
jgi:putative alpha-1,2-mannosidase